MKLARLLLIAALVLMVTIVLTVPAEPGARREHLTTVIEDAAAELCRETSAFAISMWSGGAAPVGVTVTCPAGAEVVEIPPTPRARSGSDTCTIRRIALRGALR